MDKWSDLIGKRYPGSIPCWDALRDFYRLEFGFRLPDYAHALSGVEPAEIVLGARPQWTRIEAPEFGDAALFWERDMSRPHHVGAYVGDGRIFHTSGDTGAIADLALDVFARHLEGFYRYTPATWTLVSWPHPLTDVRVERQYAHGVTLLDALRDQGVRIEREGQLAVLVGDTVVSDLAWLRRLRPRPGVLVSVRSVPGATALFAILVTLGQVVAAAVPGAATAGAALGAGVAGAFGVTSIAGITAITAASIVVSGAVIAGGLFALSTLVTPSEPKLGNPIAGPQTSPSAQGVGNEVRRFSPVPVLLGRLRVFPPMYTLPFTTSVGNERFWNLGLVVSADRCKIDHTDQLERSGIEIGGVPVEEIPSADWQIIQGGTADLEYQSEAISGGQMPSENASDFWPLSVDTSNAIGSRVLLSFNSPTFGAESIIKRTTTSSVQLNGTNQSIGALTSFDASQEWAVVLAVAVDTSDETGDHALVWFGDAATGFGIATDGFSNDKLLALRLIRANTGEEARLYMARGATRSLLWLRRVGNDLRASGIAFATQMISGFFDEIANPSFVSFGARFNGGVAEWHTAMRLQAIAIFDGRVSGGRIAELDTIAMSPLGTILRRGGELRLLEDTAVEVQANQSFETPNADQGDFVASSWRTVAIAADATQLSIDLFWPQGVFRTEIDSNGANNKAASVGIQVEFRDSDTAEWINLRDWGARRLANQNFMVLGNMNPTTAWGVGNPGTATPDGKPAFIVSETTNSPILTGLFWDVPRARYQIRVRDFTTMQARFRGGEKDKPFTQTSFQWLSARAMRRGESPLRRGSDTWALLNLKLPIKEVGASVGQVSVLAESVFREREAGAWTEPRPTRNAASLALACLQSKSLTARPLADARLSLGEWDGFTARAPFADLYTDFETNTFDLTNQVLAVGFASLRTRERVGVAEDRAGLTPDQLLTSRDMQGFSWSRRFSELPDGARVTYRDEERDWEETEVLVFRDGIDETTAETFQTVSLTGTTDRTRAIERAKKMIRMIELRNEEFRGTVWLSHLNASRGSLVRFQHHMALVGLRAGRVIDTTLNGSGDTTHITIDESAVFTTGLAYGARWKKASGTVVNQYSTPIVNPATETASVQFAAPVAAAIAPEVGDLLVVGEQGIETIECLVREMTHISVDGIPAAQVVLIPYMEQVHNAVDEPAVFDPLVSRPGGRPVLDNPQRPTILAVASDERFLTNVGGVLKPRLRIIARAGSGIGSPAFLFSARARNTSIAGSQLVFSAPAFGFPPTMLIEDVVEGDVYEVQVRAETREGLASEWSVPVFHRVVGQLLPPPSLVELRREGNELVWDAPIGLLDLDGFLVRFVLGANPGATFASATPAHEGVWRGSRFPLALLPSGQKITVLVKAVDLGGRPSLLPAVLVTELPSPRANVISTDDQRALGWPGDIAGGSVVGGDLVADLTVGDDTQPAWLDDDSLPAWLPDNSTLDEGSRSEALSYVFALTPVAEDIGRRMTFGAVWTPETALIRLQYRELGPAAAWPLADGEIEPDDDTAPGWEQPEWSDWRTWPGILGVPVRKPYEFLASMPQAFTRNVVIELVLTIDVDDRRELLNDVPVSSAGTRLPISSPFREVVQVLGTRQQVPGDVSRDFEVVDKQPIGPKIIVRDAGGNAVASSAWDFEVIGY